MVRGGRASFGCALESKTPGRLGVLPRNNGFASDRTLHTAARHLGVAYCYCTPVAPHQTLMGDHVGPHGIHVVACDRSTGVCREQRKSLASDASHFHYVDGLFVVPRKKRRRSPSRLVMV